MTTSSLDRAFEETERTGEIFAAVARVAIALVILLAAWISHDAGPAGHPLVMIAVLYALTSLVGVVLAIGRVFHRFIPYTFVAIDVSVIAFALTMLARMHNLSLAHEFSLPLFSLAFVILIHAAMRYRPILILFGFLLFVALLFLFPIIMSVPMISQSAASGSTSMLTDNPLELVLHDVGYLPLLFLSIAMVLLYYIVLRTRSLTELAIVDGRKATQLSRFFSPEVAETLGSIGTEDALTGSRQNAAVIFIDIRGFSRIAERLTPEEVAEFLSAFRTKICEIIFQHGGTVDKFIGDAVLAVFGTPIAYDDDATRAVEASFIIRDEIKAWHLCRHQQGLPCAKVGIGGHYGEVFSGIIESGQILEHSIIGDTVNVAERLERLTRELEADFVLSDDLLKAANFNTGKMRLQSKEEVQIRGHNSRIKVWYG